MSEEQKDEKTTLKDELEKIKEKLHEIEAIIKGIKEKKGRLQL